jgi:hypothetical protein
VTRFLQRYGSHPSLGGVYIWDEPMTKDFGNVAKNTDAFETLRPDLLGFTAILQSYSPWYNWGNSAEMPFNQYVDLYIRQVNPPVLCSNYYPFKYDITPRQFDESNYWKDMGFLRRAALASDLPHWFYYQARNPSESDLILRSEHLSVQVWSAVLYGVKGLSSFTAATSAIDATGGKGYLYDAIKTYNLQIAALGNTLLNLHSEAVWHGGTVNDPYADPVETSYCLVSLPASISVGAFTDDYGHRYLLVLNRDFTAAHMANLPLKKSYRIYRCDKDNGGEQSVLHESTRQLNVHLTASDAELFRIEEGTHTPPRPIIYLTQ